MRLTSQNTYICLLLWLLLWLFMQIVYAFHFFHIEQYQLFLFDRSYIVTTLGAVGGFNRLLSDFLMQFFMYPYMGAFITSLLLMLIGAFTFRLIKRMDHDSTLIYLFSLLPVLSLLYIQYEFNYFLQGTIAYLFALLLLNVYLLFDRFLGRWICTFVSVALLFWLFGSIAVLFAMVVFVREWMVAPRKWYWFLIPCLEVLMLAWLSVRFALVGEFRFAFLPDMYYHHWLKPGNVIYLSWIVLPLIVAATCLLRTKKALSGRSRWMSLAVQCIVAGLIFIYGYRHHGDTRSLKYKEMEYYSRTKQYDKVLDMNRGRVTNYLYGCLLNLSLAAKDELADSLFTFEQNGSNSLLVQMDNTYIVSMLLSDIYYMIGHTGAAMKMAFEANICAPGHYNGRMILRLAETNLIYGEYAVAEKYITLLEKSLCYRKPATALRRYLYDDDAVTGNPEYEKQRKSLPKKDFLFLSQVNDQELISLTESNPENRLPIEYTGAMFLLMKKMNLFNDFITTYYGTELLPTLPLSFQEAVIVLNEGAPDTWKERGVSQPVIARFEQFKKYILEHRNKPNVADFVKKSYGDTFWYYYMFKKLS